MDIEKLLTDKDYYEKEWQKHIKEVESNMGMTLDEFHNKLDALITPAYIAKFEKYKIVLEEWLESGQGIYNDKGEELILEDGEYFVPCFAPDVPGRNELSIFWFLSNYGHLVSASGNKVAWLPSKPHGKGERMCQKWHHPITKSIKSIEVHNLMALVFNPNATFGRAKEDIELFGTYAFRQGYGFWLNGHHRYRFADFPERVYEPENIQFLRGYVHDTLRNARTALEKIHADEGNPENALKEATIVSNLRKMLDVEVPGMIVLIWPGELYNMDGTYQSNKGEYAFILLTAEEAEKYLPNETRKQIRAYINMLNRRKEEEN